MDGSGRQGMPDGWILWLALVVGSRGWSLRLDLVVVSWLDLAVIRGSQEVATLTMLRHSRSCDTHEVALPRSARWICWSVLFAYLKWLRCSRSCDSRDAERELRDLRNEEVSR